MIKIGNKQFKSEEELCKFLVDLVHEGEEKMQKGKISTLCYEDMIEVWDDMVEKAHHEGWLSDKPHEAICDTLAEQLCVPYPDAAMDKGLEEFKQFGTRGLATDVSSMEGCGMTFLQAAESVLIYECVTGKREVAV